MAKKKKLTKAERKEARLRKGKQWLLTYTGSPKKMNKHYRERFHVDVVTAAKDLQELGVNYTQEQLDHRSPHTVLPAVPVLSLPAPFSAAGAAVLQPV